jgi:hypothetical protein
MASVAKRTGSSTDVIVGVAAINGETSTGGVSIAVILANKKYDRM